MSGETAAIEPTELLHEVRYEKTIEEAIKELRELVAETQATKTTSALARKQVRWCMLLIGCVGVAIVLIRTPLPWTNRSGVGSLLIGLAILGLCLLLVWLLLTQLRPSSTSMQRTLMIRSVERSCRSRKIPVYLGPCAVRLVDRGLETEVDGERSELAWSRVVSIRSDGAHLIVRLLLNRFIAVPLTAFGDSPQAEAFFDTVRHRAAGGLPAPASSTVASESV